MRPTTGPISRVAVTRGNICSASSPPHSVLPEITKPLGGQFRVAHRVLDGDARDTAGWRGYRCLCSRGKSHRHGAAYTYCISPHNFFGGKQLRILAGSNRATRCAIIHGARGDTERARGTATTPPSAVRSARCTHAVVSRWGSTADPEALHRSGTTSQAGRPQWPHMEGETPQALHIPRDVVPARLPSFRLLAMAWPPLDARWKLLI